MKGHLVILFLGVHLLVAKWASGCLISGQLALCNHRSFHHVPALPSYITKVDLSQNYISEVNETSFTGLEQLTELDLGLQLTNTFTVRQNAFRRLSNLTFLHLGDNKALHLEANAFVGLINLKKLNLLRNGLDESILWDKYLQPLVSLENLLLPFNEIKKVQPGLFFQNLTNLKILNLCLNPIYSLCEQDLYGFQGKYFDFLDLSSLKLIDTLDWKKCGNPFRNISVRVLDLSLNSFNVDKARLFFKAIEGTKINHLILSLNSMGSSIGYNNTKDPDKHTFEGLNESSIKTLDISKNFIFSLEFSVFSPLKEAEEITLAQNRINQIKIGAFSGLQNLQKLNLSYNLIGEIYPYTFKNLPNVTEIDLSHNHIGVVVYNSFSSLSKLTTLNLSGNSLTELHKFAPISSLQLLHLSDNRLKSIYGLSDFAKNTIVMDLSENRLRDLNDLYTILADFPFVQEITFAYNLISWCYPKKSVNQQNNLIYLDLQNNALQLVWANRVCDDVFDNLNKLLYLILNHNSLQSLPDGIFKGLTSLHYLDLSSNFLTYVSQNIFPENMKVLDLSYNILSSPDPYAFHLVSLIDLGMNRFYCDCGLKDFLMWMNQTNVTFYSPRESLKCEYPKGFQGISLIDYSTELCDDEDVLVIKLRLCLFIVSSALLTCILICIVVLIHLRGKFFIFYKRVISRFLYGQQKVASLDGFKYDAYLCFSNNDFKWVETALLKRLDSQFSERNVLRCCFEARDFLPGEDYITSIRDAIWSSRKTVCIVSKEFLKDGWCMEAFNLAQSRMLEELKDVLVMVIVGSIPHFKLMGHSGIRTFVQKREYLQWPEDIQDINWFYDRLMTKIFEQGRAESKNAIELRIIG